MSKYLCQTTEIYRVDTEAEVEKAIEEAKQDGNFTLAKYVSEFKERKQKGEVIDEYYKLTLTKIFTDIKNPDMYAQVTYKTYDGYFGGNSNDED